MNREDIKMMDLLMQDKGNKYKIYVDNDAVFVVDKDDWGEPVHTFFEFGWRFIVELMNYLELDCEEV